jgi:hypothetical protein
LINKIIPEFLKQPWTMKDECSLPTENTEQTDLEFLEVLKLSRV